MFRRKRGFTLIELMVVMTIIAILVGVSLVSFDGIRKSARDGKRKADLESVRSALEIYRTDCHTYPATADLVFGTTTSLIGAAGVGCLNVEYLNPIPTDTSTVGQYYYKMINSNKYIVCAHFEGVTSGLISECGANCGTGVCNYSVGSP